MSCRVVSRRVVLCCVVSCRVVSCRVVSRRVVSCRVVSSRVVLEGMDGRMEGRMDGGRQGQTWSDRCDIVHKWVAFLSDTSAIHLVSLSIR